ncbi:hypothetical protein NIES25_23410 [Nostoc linckia NIES-25]|nr:hypothetical protein NIES25_23410 [Nostoc linckia NIES-25]
MRSRSSRRRSLKIQYAVWWLSKKQFGAEKYDTRNNPMIMAQIENQIRYVTNANGQTTDVLVPIELWQQLISSINSDNLSLLAWVDEKEPIAQILADTANANYHRNP